MAGTALDKPRIPWGKDRGILRFFPDGSKAGVGGSSRLSGANRKKPHVMS
jgi:hypothetical protein